MRNCKIVNLIFMLEFLSLKCLTEPPKKFVLTRSRRFTKKPTPFYPTLPTITEPSNTRNNYGPPSTSYGVPDQPVQPPAYSPPIENQTPAPIIHKHIYVHVPPAEPEYPPISRPIKPQPAQKHYRIIFIKAPSPPAVQLPSLPELPRNEEKTIVYILVKKPDDTPEIILPTPASTVASKPEVYFIRYKTQEEEDYTISTMVPEVINADSGGSGLYGY